MGNTTQQGAPARNLIPRAFVTEWQQHVPWPELVQVEQDLVLSRLMIEIANNELLGAELVMRGGTCLHKLHLPAPRRYSEDLDYVRRTRSGIRPHVDALREIAAAVDLEVSSVDQTAEMVHVTLDAEPAVPPGRIRIKVETNILETTSFERTIAIRHEVNSRWWTGVAEIPTYTLEELMATKLRALYQRSQGRDLFDLWLILTELEPKESRIVEAFHHYMGGGAFGFRELATNLRDKLEDRDFLSDLAPLIADMPEGYEPSDAANLVMESLGGRLANAPSANEISEGRWKSTTG